MKKYLIMFSCSLFLGLHASGQTKPIDSTTMNMDAVYNRPFLTIGNLPVSVGGYLEAHYGFSGTEGVSDGHSFSIPRMTLFVASGTHRRIRFLSELEIEEGGEEISIEFAALDLLFRPMFNIRGGVVMNPIGAFNQNHDGPKWEFVDRPVAMTQMLPATWSNPGFGLYGKYYKRAWAFGYEVYLTNGFDGSVIDNIQNRTHLPSTKQERARFEESLNGKVLLTGKIAVKHDGIGEIGLSYMGGQYNRSVGDGLQIAPVRRISVAALDFNSTIESWGTYLVGEIAWVKVDVPDEYTRRYGEEQFGAYFDVVQTIVRRPLLGFDQAALNLACRLEYVDWNNGKFVETNASIGDEFMAITPGLSFRPVQQTTLRLNYRFSRQKDFFGNTPERTGAIRIGIASYF